MDDTILVRDARPHETDTVRALTLAAYREYESIMAPMMWTSLDGAIRGALVNRDAAEWFVAVDGDTILGSVMLFPPASDAYDGLVDGSHAPELRLLAVTSAGRGRGIGEALVHACVARATANGATEIGLHTSHSMRAAMRLYTRLGFTRAPERDFHPEGGEVVEAYRLALGTR